MQQKFNTLGDWEGGALRVGEYLGCTLRSWKLMAIAVADPEILERG